MRRLALILAFWPAAGLADVNPTPGPRDPHMQSVDYDAEQVVRLSTAPGYVLVIELSPDERVETIALGTDAGWQVTSNRRGNHLFVKQEPNAADTNMSVITDARRYSFALVPGYGSGPLLAYTVRFNYPGLNSAPDVAVEPERRVYRLSGTRNLRPVEMFDDGQATSIRWAEDAPMPAIYTVDGSGEEMIVNGAMRDGFFVVDAISPRFIFRLGNKSATASRQAAAPLP